MNIAIVKYNAGNIQSVLYALERIGITATVTDNHDILQSADKVIFPGVGEASTAMRYLKERNLNKVIKDLKQPVLGICLGMQLMCSHSEENDTDCLDIFAETVKRFNPSFCKVLATKEEDHTNAYAYISPGFPEEELIYKVPQIGWNTIFNLKTGLFKDVKENSFIYLVHSYFADLGKHTIATAEYIQPYSAALQTGNFYGVQFHPEKSAETGAQILKNFLDLNV